MHLSCRFLFLPLITAGNNKSNFSIYRILTLRDGLIAVNYTARAFVTRHMRAGEALKACPGLKLVHVKTIGKTWQQFFIDDPHWHWVILIGIMR